MKRTNAITLGEAIKQYIEALKIQPKLKEIELINKWEEILGRSVARSTTNLYVKEKTLFVKLDSSVVRNELMMIRGEIIKRLNNSVGSEIITEIVLR